MTKSLSSLHIQVCRIIDQLVRDGKVLNPYLGITLSSVWLLRMDQLLKQYVRFLEMNFLPGKCHAHFSSRVMSIIEISFLVIRQDALF